MLGLLHSTLQAIESNYKLVDRCLMDCLAKWLQRADNVVAKGVLPSWSSLSDFLRAINEVVVADKLNKLSKTSIDY